MEEVEYLRLTQGGSKAITQRMKQLLSVDLFCIYRKGHTYVIHL